MDTWVRFMVHATMSRTWEISALGYSSRNSSHKSTGPLSIISLKDYMCCKYFRVNPWVRFEWLRIILADSESIFRKRAWENISLKKQHESKFILRSCESTFLNTRMRSHIWSRILILIHFLCSNLVMNQSHIQNQYIYFVSISQYNSKKNINKNIVITFTWW